MINSSVNININENLRRTIQGKVELYNGSTRLNTFTYNDKEKGIQEITVTRTGEKGKFFGFGICQQATVKIIDKNKNLTFKKGHVLRTYFRANDSTSYDLVCPRFYIKEDVIDEKTHVHTITAYDALDAATGHVWRELGLVPPYTLTSVVSAITSLLGLAGYTIPSTGFDVSYNEAANFGGDETIRQALNALAEATQTIYYVDHNNKLTFIRLSQIFTPQYTIHKQDYFEFTQALPVTITKIAHISELGDNYEFGTDTGVCQYIRDNPFWNNRNDISSLVRNGSSRISGLTIVPHTLKWRGNFLTEIGDRVLIETANGNVDTYILDDSFSYTGGFNQTCSWEYTPEGEKITAANPVTIGEKINQTYAKVDKVDRKVTLYASEIDDTVSSVGELQVGTELINASIQSIERQLVEVDTDIEDALNQANTRIDSLYSDVALKLDKTGVEITVEQKLEQGVDKVVTSSKNYTFDDTGLNIASSDSEISTRILEDGMRIYKNDEEVLVANNRGVTATDLYATTFLIIGDNSRLENSGRRTACFWIGPSEE